jgi:hypothetical protein
MIRWTCQGMKPAYGAIPRSMTTTNHRNQAMIQSAATVKPVRLARSAAYRRSHGSSNHERNGRSRPYCEVSR